MKNLICSLCICLLLALTACASTISANHMNVYSGNDKKLMVSIDDNEEILQMLDIINNYKEFDGIVPIDKPDYIVELSPIDNSNSSEEYKIWIKDKNIIHLPPQLIKEPSKLSIPTHSSSSETRLKIRI